MMLPIVLASMLVAPRPLLLAHYMPWFASRPVSGAWGWHWTMGKTDPDKGELASHYHPLLGAYDSGDLALIECHVQLLKLAGFDGVLIDWYGDVDCLDYKQIDRNTERLIQALTRAKMKFGLVYEDQTVPQILARTTLPKDQAVTAGQALLARTARRWMRSPQYLTLNGRPLLLVFGPQYYRDAEWPKMLDGLRPTPMLFTLHQPIASASGTFDWPLPEGGSDAAEHRRKAYLSANSDPSRMIPVAFPRFHDYYAEAGVRPAYGRVDDADGATYRTSLRESLATHAPFVQVATFNDWGEGTVIEPSQEFGYRDLETTQRLAGVRFSPQDLRLPIRLYQLRKRQDPTLAPRLASISAELLAGRTASARRQLRTLP